MGIRFSLILNIVLIFSSTVYGQQVTVSGFIYEMGSRETLSQVNISVLDSSAGAFSNDYGFYSLEVTKGREVAIQFSSIGYQSVIKKILADKDFELNVTLLPTVSYLDEIIITPEDRSDPRQLSGINLSMGMVKTCRLFWVKKM